jgi:hypothetical protein
MATGTRGQQQQAQAQQDQPPAQAKPNPTFSLTRGTRDGIAILDYSTKVAASLYKDATSELSEDLYDCSPDGLIQFIISVKVRAEAFGWSETDRVLWIVPKDGDKKINLTTDYGQVSLQRIQEMEDARMHLATRLAQDNRALYEAFSNSLTKKDWQESASTKPNSRRS